MRILTCQKDIRPNHQFYEYLSFWFKWTAFLFHFLKILSKNKSLSMLFFNQIRYLQKWRQCFFLFLMSIIWNKVAFQLLFCLPSPKTFRMQKYVMLNLSTHMLTVPNCRMKGRLLCLNRKLWVQNIIMAHLLFMDIKTLFWKRVSER